MNFVNMNNMERNDLIKFFFNMGLSQKDILFALADFGIILSQRHLRRVLKEMDLFRRKFYTDISEVVYFIDKQLKTSGKLHGYRWMHQKCELEGIKVRKEDVRLILSALDPAGCELRYVFLKTYWCWLVRDVTV